MIARLPYTGLREAILTHPTFAEGLNPLFASAPSMSKEAEENAALKSEDREKKAGEVQPAQRIA